MRKTNLKFIAGKAKSNIEDDMDALFRLPLSDFIDARKTLSARLKKEGRATEAERVKTLAKPSISAWAVNQLYWRQRASFDQLISTGQRLRQAQTTGRAGKGGDLRTAFDERRELLTQMSESATALLNDAGHNPALDTLRRIASTLEAMSAYTSLPEGMSAGRLSKDIDPPGFDLLTSFVTDAGRTRATSEQPRVSSAKKSVSTPTKTRPESNAREIRRLKEERQAKLAAAKVSLQQTKRSLVTARARKQSVEKAHRKIDAEAKDAEKHRRETERRLNEASAASEAATRRLRNIAVELELAKKESDEAQRTVETASRELESLFRES
jgi:hypothetical protein